MAQTAAGASSVDRTSFVVVGCPRATHVGCAVLGAAFKAVKRAAALLPADDAQAGEYTRILFGLRRGEFAGVHITGELRYEAARTADELDVSAVDPVAALRDLMPDGADYVFDAIGMTKTTEQAIEMLGLGGAAVIVGLPPTGARASFEPLVLAEADQKILGSNYGSVRPAIDLPLLVDRYMNGELLLDELVSDRRPLDQAVQSLDDLDQGRALRTLLIP